MRAGLGRNQFALGAGEGQHVFGDRVTLGVIAVQQPDRRPAVDLGGELPAKVEGILDAEVQTLASERRMDVCRVACEEHPAHPVPFGKPGGVGETGQRARRVSAEVGARVRPQLRPELLQRRRHRAILGHGRRGDDGSVEAVSSRADAEAPVGLAHLLRHRGQFVGRRGHLDLAEEPLCLGGLAGEVDSDQSPHQASSTVAADQPPRAQQRTVGELDPDPVLVLLDAGHLEATTDLCAEFDGTLLQEAIGDRLGDAEDVRVRGVQVHRPRAGDSGEPADTAGILLPVSEEPVQQPALVHDLDASRVQAERADGPARFSVLLQHEHVHIVEPQLAR